MPTPSKARHFIESDQNQQLWGSQTQVLSTLLLMGNSSFQCGALRKEKRTFFFFFWWLKKKNKKNQT
jgi:hypothetical protein